MTDDDGIAYVTSREFQDDVKPFTEKWDREWIRYFFQHDQSYFITYAGTNYALNTSKKQVAAFSAQESRERQLTPGQEHTRLVIYVPGEAYVDKDVFEMGCGAGKLGRILGKLVRSYVGYDYSPLGLYVARLTSPATCRYVHASDVEAVKSLRNSFDLCLGRHFFIHNNFGNARWVLRFLRELARDDGLIQADFWNADEPAEGVYPAKSPLLPNTASCAFFYTEDEIRELADQCGLELLSIERTQNPPRTYANFRRNSPHQQDE